MIIITAVILKHLSVISVFLIEPLKGVVKYHVLLIDSY